MKESSFQVKLAGRTIRVIPFTMNLIKFCEDYLTDDSAEPDFTVSIMHEDIERERAKAYETSAGADIPGTDYSESYLETLVLGRKAADGLMDYDVLLAHGSCLSLDGAGYLFAAPSGVGKSTHAGIWREYFGDRVVMINDDKPYLKITDSGVIAYGSPWNGEHHMGSNTSACLKCICFLHQDLTNHIERLTPEDAYPELFGQIYRPRDVKAIEKKLAMVDRLGRQVELYRLFCNTDPEAARVAYEGIII